MAEILTKSITEKKPKFTENKPISEIPKKKPKGRMPKVIKYKNPNKNKVVLGNVQNGISVKNPPVIIKDGKRVK